MTTAFQLQLSDDLENARRSASERMTALRDELVNLDARGDIGDQNRAAAERRNLVANIIRTHEQMEEIEEALRRIRSGAYGHCGDCEEPIPESRLLVQPWSQRCLSCQERWESVTPQFSVRNVQLMPSLQEGA